MAELSPTKQELLERWVPARPWGAGAFRMIGAYRFDDPAGEVGIETHLLQAGDRVLQVPLTYRGAPLAGADAALITTMQHSVLGTRWIYDGCADPVYVAALLAVMASEVAQAEEWVERADGPARRESPVRVAGNGGRPSVTWGPGVSAPVDDAVATVIGDGLVVCRVVGATPPAAGPVLTGTWPGRDAPAVLAFAR